MTRPTPRPTCAPTVRKVLEATGLPLIVYGPGQTELDNDFLVAVAEEGKGERLVLGLCEEKNYRTIVAGALANDQLVIASTAMDVNLAKQLNILISDMGLPLDRILMDPTCAAVGYGIEYGYSVMERLRLAALTGDKMTQLPMIVTVGNEAWRQKESHVGEGVPEAWGDWQERAHQLGDPDRRRAGRIGSQPARPPPPRVGTARQAMIDELMAGIEPKEERTMALSGMQIYKLLPRTNCKECGYPTCLAFAMKLARQAGRTGRLSLRVRRIQGASWKQPLSRQSAW